jgi:hypothetical protein
MNKLSVLFAVFLYTEEDALLASYMRKHVEDLHYMSGHQCMFFTIEKPASEWSKEVRRALGVLAGDYFDALWGRLGTDSFAPFNKKKAYEIGERFGVKPNTTTRLHSN